MRALLLALVIANIAHAEPTAKDRAHQLFKQGEAAYQAGHYNEAIDKYTDAYSLVPVPLLLFDLGQAYRMRGERDKAITNYQKYIDADPNGRAVAEAREHVDELKAQIQKEEEAKRALAEQQRKAAEQARLEQQQELAARKAADEAARRRAAEEKRQHDALVAQQKVERARADAARPVWKKPWFWATIGAAVVVVGVAAGVGAAYGSHDRDPTATFGNVQAN